LPSFEVTFRFVSPRAIVFLVAYSRYHTVLWVDESEYLPDEGIQVLLFLSIDNIAMELVVINILHTNDMIFMVYGV
jgi:hypothetical protein